MWWKCTAVGKSVFLTLGFTALEYYLIQLSSQSGGWVTRKAEETTRLSVEKLFAMRDYVQNGNDVFSNMTSRERWGSYRLVSGLPCVLRLFLDSHIGVKPRTKETQETRGDPLRLKLSKIHMTRVAGQRGDKTPLIIRMSVLSIKPRSSTSTLNLDSNDLILETGRYTYSIENNIQCICCTSIKM